MELKKVIRMGHPTLRQVAEDVLRSDIKGRQFQRLIQEMYEAMKREGGIGIAAPQINISKKVCLIELPENNERYGNLEKSELIIIINPEITFLTDELQGFYEGCLSVPGLRGYVERPKKIKVNYLDENAKPKEIIAEGFLATVFQHEIDHLFGKLYVDRITDLTKLYFNEEYEQFEANSNSEDNSIE